MIMKIIINFIIITAAIAIILNFAIKVIIIAKVVIFVLN